MPDRVSHEDLRDALQEIRASVGTMAAALAAIEAADAARNRGLLARLPSTSWSQVGCVVLVVVIAALAIVYATRR